MTWQKSWPFQQRSNSNRRPTASDFTILEITLMSVREKQARTDVLKQTSESILIL